MNLLTKLGLLVLLTMVGIYLHGIGTFRWGVGNEFEKNDQIIRQIPETIGKWKLDGEGSPLSENVQAELGVREYVSSVYTDGVDRVTLLLMSGTTERLVRHPPEICYSASGNQFLDKPKDVTVDAGGTEQRFRMIPMRRAMEGNGDFVVVYGFFHEGQFDSPVYPRIHYHGNPSIIKIQVLCARPEGTDATVPPSASDFITALTAVMKERNVAMLTR